MDKIVPPNTPQKQCFKCKQWKLATNDFFSRMKTGRYGLCGTCKTCRNLAWQESHPDAKPRRVEYDHPLPDGYKRCSHCRKELPATSDYFQKHSNGNFQPRCKECRSDDQKVYADAHKKERSAYGKRYRAINGERIRARVRRNRAHINARKRKRYKEIPSVHEARLLSGRNDRKKHSERHKAVFHAYYVEHREYYRMKDRERTAREKGVAGKHTVAQIQEQLKRQKYKCYYAACGHAKFEKKEGKYVYEVEHTFPLIRAVGTDIPANDISYLVLACRSCNASKSDKLPHEWPEGGRLL